MKIVACLIYDIKEVYFTWTHHLEDNTFTKERLDQAVANLECATSCNIVQVECLAIKNSNNWPILLSCTYQKFQNRKKQRPFNYEASWNKDGECLEVVARLWNQTSVNLEQKLLWCGDDLIK